jgi:hypothetical protein
MVARDASEARRKDRMLMASNQVNEGIEDDLNNRR